jgi:hypothetical protein
MNVVRLKVDGTLNTNPQVIIDNCIQYFTKLLGQKCFWISNMREAREMLFQSVKGSVGQ